MAIDVTGLTLIGQGRHGKVYRIDQHSCIKIYRRKKYMQMEYEALKGTERFPFFPTVYECKDNYMIREYFSGPNLVEYLRGHDFNKNIAKQLLAIIDSFAQLGYTRLDCRLPHIIVTQREQLKVIDPTRNRDKRTAYPATMLKELDRLGFKSTFLEYTKTLRPDLYTEWKLGGEKDGI